MLTMMGGPTTPTGEMAATTLAATAALSLAAFPSVTRQFQLAMVIRYLEFVELLLS